MVVLRNIKYLLAVATATVMSSFPAQALTLHQFNFTGLYWPDGATVKGSFSYDDSSYSGILRENQVQSFEIFFEKDGQVLKSYSGLSSLFRLEFDTIAKTVNAIDAGAFSSWYWESEPIGDGPTGSLSFVKGPTANLGGAGCDGMIWEIVPMGADNGVISGGSCDGVSSPQPNPTEPIGERPNPSQPIVVRPNPSQPEPKDVPEPTSAVALLLLGAAWALKRKTPFSPGMQFAGISAAKASKAE